MYVEYANKEGKEGLYRASHVPMLLGLRKQVLSTFKI